MPPKPRPGILQIQPYKAGESETKSQYKTIKLSSNETPLGASPKAIEAFESLASDLHRYPDSSAGKLRQAIGEVYKLNPDQIICGAGSDEIISMLCLAYAGEGDEILYSEHGFLMYPISAMAVGATPKTASEKNLTTDVDALLGAVTDKTKIVFIANPNNPTGSYINKSEIKRLRKNLRDDIILVLDGAYAEYVSDEDYTAGADIVDLGDNTVMTRTFSKIYGLAGLRIGWAYAPSNIIDILNRVRGPFNVSSVAIKAAIAAVKDVEFTEKAKKYNEKCKAKLVKQLSGIGLKTHPSVGNFFLIEFPDGAKNANAANDFLKSRGIISRNVASYGLANCLRLTVGLEEENDFVVETLSEFLR